MDEQLVSTPVGKARLDWYPTRGAQRATVVLGHGTATGVEARDLQALARALPPLGITVGPRDPALSHRRQSAGCRRTVPRPGVDRNLAPRVRCGSAPGCRRP